MNFRQAFFDALITGVPLIKTSAPAGYLPEFLSVPAEIAENLPYIQAYSAIHASYPYHYEISKLNSFCMIYTESGSGLLTTDGRNYSLNTGTIAFINCSQWHRVEIKQSPWTCKAYFISGSSVAFFYSNFMLDNGNLHSLLPETAIAGKIRLLHEFLTKSPDLHFIHSRYISDILFELLMERNKFYYATPNNCDTIFRIRREMDSHYMENITLELLEQKYHINRYQICREFTKHFHISPIQYLNQRKVEAVKEILLRTDGKIARIGRMAGFENPNNLIRQFRNQTGMTPMEYRRQAQAAQAGKNPVD